VSQQARKEQEGLVVRRLTLGAGAAALGLAWYFTASATTAVPVAFGAGQAPEQPVVGMEQLDDHVFVRTVHVAAPRPPAGGVQAGTAAAGGGQAGVRTTGGTTAGGTTAVASQSGTAQAATSSAPVAIAQPVPAAAPAPTPKPAATTGASTPAK
jgi:hypothetical protein